MEPYAALGGHCPLLARKFLPDTAQAVLNLVTDCKTRLRITVLQDCLDGAARRLLGMQERQLGGGGAAASQPRGSGRDLRWDVHEEEVELGKHLGRRRHLQAVPGSWVARPEPIGAREQGSARGSGHDGDPQAPGYGLGVGMGVAELQAA